MAVTIAVRFPHGQYHATAWDSAPNAGDVEWPPTPWRLARALLSVWYSRHPSIDESTLTGVLDVLREPPRYWLPPATPEHTRHWLPQVKHRRWDSVSTAMTVDASLHVDPGDHVIYLWEDAEPSAEVRRALAQLVTSVPYLGRAESVCEARLLTEDDESLLNLDAAGWVGPSDEGTHRVLCLGSDTTRDDLEMTPDAMRAAKLPRPLGSRWVAYDRPVRTPGQRPDALGARCLDGRGVAGPHVLRWRVQSTAPFLAVHGLLATDALRATRLAAIERLGIGVDDRLLHGHLARRSDGRPHEFDAHEGAHWLWLEGDAHAPQAPAFSWSSTSSEPAADSIPSKRVVRDLALWVPAGIPTATLDGLTRGGLFRPTGYQPRGYVPADLQLVGAGSPAEVLPELTSTATDEWVSATPFLSTRHRRPNETFEAFLSGNVTREWRRRCEHQDDAPQVARVECIDDHYGPRWAARYHRRRWLLPRSTARRRGIPEPTLQTMVRIGFDRPVRGPVSLGALSHFGFGLFVPMR